jgi:hypothetical protein
MQEQLEGYMDSAKKFQALCEYIQAYPDENPDALRKVVDIQFSRQKWSQLLTKPALSLRLFTFVLVSDGINARHCSQQK